MMKKYITVHDLMMKLANLPKRYHSWKVGIEDTQGHDIIHYEFTLIVSHVDTEEE